MAEPTEIDSGREVSRRVLLCGLGPLPLGEPERIYAPGLRLASFAGVLVRAGVTVDVLDVEFGSGAVHGAGGRLHHVRDEAGVLCADTIPLTSASPAELVAGQMVAGRYSAVVATTDVMARACAEACGTVPFWCDFNGYPMAERQSLARVYDCDDGLIDQWDYLLAPLLRADRFSTCSDSQRLALVGELGACGRLNRLNDGWPLVVSLPPGWVRKDLKPTDIPLRGKLVPDDAFVVLWTGGYNTWADTDTLSAGVLEAMRRNPRLHYVSTGGAIEGHDDRTFATFRARVEATEMAEHFHFVGWVPTQEIPDYYALADVAINCDRPCIDTETGWRNRMQEWIAGGVPVLTTDLCDLTRDLTARGLIDTFAVGEPDSLAETLLAVAAREKQVAVDKAEAARSYVLEAYAPEHLLGQLVQWTRSPRRAPDLREPAAGMPGVPFEVPDNTLARRRVGEWRQAFQRPGLLSRLKGWVRRRIGGAD